MTTRQREVALLVARGLSNKSIARLLGVTEGTVKLHLHNVFGKLSVRNRTELALAMLATELVSTPDLDAAA